MGACASQVAQATQIRQGKASNSVKAANYTPKMTSSYTLESSKAAKSGKRKQAGQGGQDQGKVGARQHPHVCGALARVSRIGWRRWRKQRKLRIQDLRSDVLCAAACVWLCVRIDHFNFQLDDVVCSPIWLVIP